MLIVHLKVGTCRKPLLLQRAPLYLRFVMRGADWNTLDALDQLDDTPSVGETVYAAKRASIATVHLDGVKDGKPFARWEETAIYELVANQPPQAVLRDNDQWSSWAFEEYELQRPSPTLR